MKDVIQSGEHWGSREACAIGVTLILSLICPTARGQVQIDFDLTAGDKLLGYENFGNETLDLAALAICCDSEGMFRDFVAVTASDRGTGCPSPNPLRIYEQTGVDNFLLHASLDPLQGVRPLAVAMDEDLLVVGLGPVRSNQDGYAVVYRRDTNGVWNLEDTLTASDPEPWDEFGTSVGVMVQGEPGQFDTIVVGAANEGSGANVTSFQQGIGAAYVFQYVGGIWIEVTKLTPPDGDIRDRFGEAVTVRKRFSIGALILVGAPDHSPMG
jgi:hypothetical protein